MDFEYSINCDEISIHSHSRIIFIIPIYFRSLEDWSNKYDQELEKFITARTQKYENLGVTIDSERRIRWDIEFNQRSIPWKYNEIIGYVEIRYQNNSLHAFIFFTDAKRHSAIMKHKRFLIFKYLGIVSENISDKLNDDIKADLNGFIENIKIRNKVIKKYYLDLEEFNNIASLIDFSKLINTEENTN